MRNALAALALVTLVSLAPTQVGSADLAEADEAFRLNDFDAAVEGYTKVVRGDPKNGRAWFRLAQSQHAREDFRAAVTSYQRALDVRFAVLQAKYNIACSYARAGDSANALQALEDAISAGYTPHDQIAIDEDFASVRQTAQFASLMHRAQFPVEHYSEGRRLSALVGTWRTDDGGVFTSNVTSKGHAVRLDLVSDGSQELMLLLYFAAPDTWSVTGGARDGSTFEGPVTFEGSEIVCTGKRALEGEKEETRVRISLDSARRGQLALERRDGGQWSVEKTFELDPSN